MNIKVFIILAVLIACSIQSYADDIKVGFFRRTFLTLNYEEVCVVAKTPEDICARVRCHVKYRSDIYDELTKGKETWQKGYGDCEDFAGLVSEICAINGITTEVIVLYPKNSFQGHAITVGKTKNGLWFSSNGKYKEAKSMEDVVKKVSNEMRWQNKEVVYNHIESINLTFASKWINNSP